MSDIKRVFSTPNQNLYSSDYIQFKKSKIKYKATVDLAKTMTENGGSLPMTTNNVIKTYKGPYKFSSTFLPNNPNGTYCLNQSTSYEDLLDITKGKYLLTPPPLDIPALNKNNINISQLFNGPFIDSTFQGVGLQMVVSPAPDANTLLYNVDTSYNQLIYVDPTYSLFYNTREQCYTSLFNFNYITLNNSYLAFMAMKKIQNKNVLNGFHYPMKFALPYDDIYCLDSFNDVQGDTIIPIIITNAYNIDPPNNNIYFDWFPPVFNGDILEGPYKVTYTVNGATTTVPNLPYNITTYTIPGSSNTNHQYTIYVEKQDGIQLITGYVSFRSEDLVAPLIISTAVGVVNDSTRATITWLPPTLGNALLTTGGYNVYIGVALVFTTLLLTYTVTGLGLNTQSIIKVKGMNSASTEIFDSQDLVAPLVITTNISRTSGIYIEWLPITLGGSALTTAYDISYNGINLYTGDIQTLPNATSYDIPLTYGVVFYDIYVRSTTNTFISQTIQQTMIIPEVIVYNNPHVFPKSGGVSGEVGLIVGVLSGSWPYGYSDFTSVVITNTTAGGGFETFNAASTPTYANCLNKYLVFGELATSGGFINTLPTISVANIAYVNISGVADDVSAGQIISFAFSGGSAPAPATYTCYYNPGSIDITQGEVHNMFYSITSNTISGISSTGMFTTGWKGYDSGITPQPILDAWGITSNSGSPPAAPLITSGSPPNHQFDAQTNIGATYDYYYGIPKMITPNY